MEHPDNAPPPAYSETDIYSALTSSSALCPSSAHQGADDASVTASSSRSNIIYTPPETPNAQDDGTGTFPVTASALASAQAFFAVRPAAGRPSGGAHIVHAIHFAESMTPADIPCPGWATDRRITDQDWHNFVNHLLALHAGKANEHIADRKLRAEEEGTPSEAGQTMAGSQFDPTRSPANASRREGSFEAALQTVHDWNASFFVPRGVTIRLDPVPGFLDMPRAWNQTASDVFREPPYRTSARSSTSNDSSSSSGTGSSLGSLVDWDEMNNNQLPIVSQSIWNWARSVEPVPKAEYKRVKAEIKAAKGARPASSAAQQKEIKKLLAQWKEVKKSHKATKKMARKAAKKEKKTRKRERKAGKRESKRKTKNQEPSESGEARRDGPTAGSHTHGTGSAPLGAPPPNRLGASGPTPGLFGTGALGPGPDRRGGPGVFRLFSGGRGGWDHVHAFTERAALDSARQAREDAAATAAAAVRHGHATRDAALRDAAASREAAQKTAAASREAAQRTAAAAVHHAHASREAAQRTAAAAVHHGHATRDAALRDAAVSREAAQRTAAAAVHHAHASREAALRDAAVSREAALREAAASQQGAQAAAARAREEARLHRAAWQLWGGGTSWSWSQAPYSTPSDRERERAGPGEEQPPASSDLQTQNAQQEKRDASAAQAGPEDANVPDQARRERAAEIRELENRLVALRMEADEALAKQLAEEEARGGRPS